MSTEIRNTRVATIIILYPVVTALVAVLINLLIFGVKPMVITLPDASVLAALIIASALLVLNHTWLMTSTELTRLKYNIRTTPEEWAAHDVQRQDITTEGWRELERRHNAHRNTTENVLYLVPLAHRALPDLFVTARRPDLDHRLCLRPPRLHRQLLARG